MIFRTNKSDYSVGIKCIKLAMLICLEKEVLPVQWALSEVPASHIH